jgi:hypothetical protein
MSLRGSDENRPLASGRLSRVEPTESVTKPTLRLDCPLPILNPPVTEDAPELRVLAENGVTRLKSGLREVYS